MNRFNQQHNQDQRYGERTPYSHHHHQQQPLIQQQQQQQQQQKQNQQPHNWNVTQTSSPYDEKYPVASYDTDYISREEAIEKDYWRGRVNHLLSLSGTDFYNQGIVISEERYDGHYNYCFYLDGVKKNIITLTEEVHKYLGKLCTLRHEMATVRDQLRKVDTQKFATWIVVTREAQQLHDSNKVSLFDRIGKRVTKKDIYKLLICIFGLALSLYLLLDHWSEYKEPWKNLIRVFETLHKE